MVDRRMSVVLIVVGIILIAISILAHNLGLGSPGLGLKKIIGLVAGVILVLVGLWGAFARQPVG